MPPVPRIWDRALRLLPRGFRERHAEEMTEVLRAHLEGRDRRGRTIVLVRALADVLREAAVQRARAVRPTPGWLRDIGYAVRTLRRRPAFTAVAVLTLALGAGVTTAVGSLVYTVVLAPTPYEDPHEIVQIAVEGDDRRTVMVPTRDVATLQEAAPRSLTLGIARFRDVAVGGQEAPERVRGTIVTGSTLPMLGVEPLLGRLPGPSDDVRGGPCVTVLSHELWTRRFGGAAAVVGDVARLDGEPCVVLGVMPEGFAYPAPYYAPGDLWLLAGPEEVDWNSPDGWFMVFGRLGSGTDPALARERVAAIPLADGDGRRFTATRWAEQHRRSAPELLVLLAAAALVLLIACVNLATLQLGRNVDRRREIATRVALGASRGRLVRLMAAEAAVLTLLGAAGGLVVATVGVDLIVALRSFYIPRMEEVAIDGTAVLICLALAAVAGVAGAALPALALGGWRRPGGLRGGGRGLTPTRRGRRFGRILVTVETALAIVLLSGAVLLLRSYRTLTALDPGFASAHVLHARITPPATRYPGDASLSAFFGEVEERIRAVPDVREVALAYVPPGVGSRPDRRFEILGRPPFGEAGPETVWRPVSSSYFRTLDIGLLRGGGLDDHRDTPRTVVVNETFARRFFPEAEAVGEAIRPLEGPGAEAVWRIVGVVEDVHEEYAHAPVPPAVYVRYEDAPRRSMAVLARTTAEPTAAAEPIRRAVADIDPDLPLYAVRDLDFLLAGEYDLNRLGMTLMSLFAGTALLLAISGIYGTVAHLVGRRLREMGIRIALGAVGRDVVRLVVGDSFRAALLGAGLGVAVTLLLGGHLRALTPTWAGVDARILAAAALAVTAVALVSAWFPARRAASADPVRALRAE